MKQQIALFAGLVMACGVANAQDPAAALNNVLVNATSGLAGVSAENGTDPNSNGAGSGLIGTAHFLGDALTGAGLEFTDAGSEGGTLFANNLQAGTRALTIAFQDTALTLGPAIDQSGQVVVALIQGDTGPTLVFLGNADDLTLPVRDAVINGTSGLAGVPAENGTDPDSEGAGSGIIGGSDYLGDVLLGTGRELNDGSDEGGELVGNDGRAVSRILAIFIIDAGGDSATPAADAVFDAGVQFNAAAAQGGEMLGQALRDLTVQLAAGIDDGGASLGHSIDRGGQTMGSLLKTSFQVTLPGL